MNLTLNNIKGIGYGLKRKIEPQAELRRSGKKIKVEITHAALLFVLVLTGHAKVLCFFLVVFV